MNLELLVPLGLVFISVAIAVGSLASVALARTAPARRRLDPTAVSAAPKAPGWMGGALRSAKRPAKQLSKTTEGASSRAVQLQRRLEAAGWREPEAAGLYTLA